MDAKVIAKRLIILRGNRTQKDISDEIGVCQSTYAMYETGKRIPSDYNKEKIAICFGKSVQEIFFN